MERLPRCGKVRHTTADRAEEVLTEMVGKRAAENQLSGTTMPFVGTMSE